MGDATWLDVMPLLPLARGVPIVHRHDPDFRKVCLLQSPTGWWCDYGGSTPNYRIDLDDPQGFAYALRLMAQRNPGGNAERLTRAMVDWGRIALGVQRRYWLDETTDDDRMALARALAEVLGG